MTGKAKIRKLYAIFYFFSGADMALGLALP